MGSGTKQVSLATRGGGATGSGAVANSFGRMAVVLGSWQACAGRQEGVGGIYEVMAAGRSDQRCRRTTIVFEF